MGEDPPGGTEKDPAQKAGYLGDIREEYSGLALHMLVLPQLTSSSEEVARLEKNLGQYKGSRESRGSKQSGEGSREGSEEQRKQARRVLGFEV